MGSIFSKPKIPAPPPPPPVAPMPDESAVRAAKVKEMAAMQQRGGRQSTFLSGKGNIGL
jgi:hypothetical protein